MTADRVPVTLLGGYLGAGKTTIVNRLLAATERPTIVLVNDIGAVNVDAQLVADHDGETMTLTNGCVCCAIADDLAPALERVRALADGPAPPAQVVIELSGVAEPARVAPWASTTGFRLDGIVVAADADQIVELASRRFVGDTIRTQLSAADLVLLTKTDLAADGGRVGRRFVASASSAPIVDATACDVGAIIGIGGARLAGAASVRDGPTAHPHTVRTLDVGPVDRTALATLIEQLPDDVVRAKGVVTCVDAQHPIEVHVVGRRRTLRERPDLAATSPTTSIVVVSVAA